MITFLTAFISMMFATKTADDPLAFAILGAATVCSIAYINRDGFDG